jgi:hypothetical protein
MNGFFLNPPGEADGSARPARVSLILRILALLFAASVVMSAQTSRLPTADATRQQAQTSANTGGREPQPPGPPPKIAIDGPVSVVGQPDYWQTVYDNVFQGLTLLFAAVAAGAAIAAWRANKRSADAEMRQAEAAAEQLAIAKQQLEIATSARVYVEGVTAVNFQPGQEAIFFLRIVNAGPVPAEKVNVFIEITHSGGGTKPTGAGNTVLVPANGHRDYDFRSGFLLPAHLGDLQKWDLKIEGTVTHGKNVENYCYKYNLWTEQHQRPDGVRLFVPCDYDARRNVTVRAESGVYAIGSVAKLVVRNAKDDEPKDKP